MNREYNDNKMYNSALDELRFSEEAKSRMVDRLMTAAEQPEQPVTIHRVRRFRASRWSAWLPLWC